MAKKSYIWVLPQGDVWVVKKEKAGRASAIRNTKKEAYEAARNIALNQNLSIKVCGADGKIERVVTPNEARDNECFITSACVKYYQLPDDCYQLRTLRQFRDDFLIRDSKYIYLVQQYYNIAPRIVELLESDRAKKELFDRIFIKINYACSEIENNRYENAVKVYFDTVIYLTEHFKKIL